MQSWRRPGLLQHKHLLSMDAAICHYFRFFSTANLIGLILRHNVGVIILDTDTLWTQTATV